MDGMLSQDEINALLNSMDADSDGGNESADSGAPAGGESTNSKADLLSSMEKDAMGEISNISMGTAATTLSSLVNQKVDITTPKVEPSDWEGLISGYTDNCVLLQISYREGLDGNNIFILKESDVKIIADLMMGGSGTPDMAGELTELHLSAISEAMNQMMGSAATSLSSMLSMKIDISPPVATSMDMSNPDEAFDKDSLSDFLQGDFVKISFRMQIGTLVDSEIMQLFPLEFCRTLCNKFGVGDSSSSAGDSSSAAVQQPAAPTAAPAPAPAPAPMAPQVDMQQQPMMAPPMMDPMMGYGQPMAQGMPMMGMPMGYGQPMMGMPMQQAPMQNVNVQQAQFQAFSPEVAAINQNQNIGLIMDVPLEVTVELGRTRKSIQDILDFAPGTIVELNKIAGEPVDVLVNGKYVAKGEVVVIEESFGVRVTEIIKD